MHVYILKEYLVERVQTLPPTPGGVIGKMCALSATVQGENKIHFFPNVYTVLFNASREVVC